MAIKTALLPEFDHEMGTTRRVLARVPEADLAWKPHEKSFSLGQLAGHIANIPRWVEITLDGSSFDVSLNPDDARPRAPESLQWLLDTFDENVKTARAKIDAQPDSALYVPWSLLSGGQEVFTLPKVAVLRSFVMNHMIHHRGQLSVYLRLRNVPLPSIYGPTADEG